MSVNEKLTAIADNIRTKTGKTDSLTLDDIATGVEDVYRSGKEQQNLDFWDIFTKSYTRSNYENAFAYLGCSNGMAVPENMFPKPQGNQRIKPREAKYMFRSGKMFTKITADLFDFSGITSSNATYMFYDADMITEIEDVGFGKGSPGNLQYAFYNATKLTKIAKITVNENITWVSTFNYCNALTYIRFEGTLGRSISFRNSPLDVDSLKNIITVMKDFTGSSNEYNCNLTVKGTAFDALEAEGATAEYNGTPCTWAELMDNKKWSLVKA